MTFHENVNIIKLVCRANVEVCNDLYAAVATTTKLNTEFIG